VKIAKPSEDDKSLFRDLVPERPDVEVKAMFGNVGAFVNGAASGTWTVVAGSGTDELEGISGASEFSVPQGEEAFPFALDYDVGGPGGNS